ncbi:hypothetical protein SNEBB_005845 [Seison nebaliae]|nr:hypothetical protein SNEBB_005845 [Seison nebaliae]
MWNIIILIIFLTHLTESKKYDLDCKFPFKINKKSFNRCINLNKTHTWCKIHGRIGERDWDYCDETRKHSLSWNKNNLNRKRSASNNKKKRNCKMENIEIFKKVKRKYDVPVVPPDTKIEINCPDIGYKIKVFDGKKYKFLETIKATCLPSGTWKYDSELVGCFKDNEKKKKKNKIRRIDLHKTKILVKENMEINYIKNYKGWIEIAKKNVDRASKEKSKRFLDVFAQSLELPLPKTVNSNLRKRNVGKTVVNSLWNQLPKTDKSFLNTQLSIVLDSPHQKRSFNDFYLKSISNPKVFGIERLKEFFRKKDKKKKEFKNTILAILLDDVINLQPINSENNFNSNKLQNQKKKSINRKTEKKLLGNEDNSEKYEFVEPSKEREEFFSRRRLFRQFQKKKNQLKNMEKRDLNEIDLSKYDIVTPKDNDTFYQFINNELKNKSKHSIRIMEGELTHKNFNSVSFDNDEEKTRVKKYILNLPINYLENLKIKKGKLEDFSSTIQEYLCSINNGKLPILYEAENFETYIVEPFEETLCARNHKSPKTIILMEPIKTTTTTTTTTIFATTITHLSTLNDNQRGTIIISHDNGEKISEKDMKKMMKENKKKIKEKSEENIEKTSDKLTDKIGKALDKLHILESKENLTNVAVKTGLNLLKNLVRRRNGVTQEPTQLFSLRNRQELPIKKMKDYNSLSKIKSVKLGNKNIRFYKNRKLVKLGRPSPKNLQRKPKTFITRRITPSKIQSRLHRKSKMIRKNNEKKIKWIRDSRPNNFNLNLENDFPITKKKEFGRILQTISDRNQNSLVTKKFHSKNIGKLYNDFDRITTISQSYTTGSPVTRKKRSERITDSIKKDNFNYSVNDNFNNKILSTTSSMQITTSNNFEQDSLELMNDKLSISKNNEIGEQEKNEKKRISDEEITSKVVNSTSKQNNFTKSKLFSWETGYTTSAFMESIANISINRRLSNNDTKLVEKEINITNMVTGEAEINEDSFTIFETELIPLPVTTTIDVYSNVKWRTNSKRNNTKKVPIQRKKLPEKKLEIPDKKIETFSTKSKKDFKKLLTSDKKVFQKFTTQVITVKSKKKNEIDEKKITTHFIPHTILVTEGEKSGVLNEMDKIEKNKIFTLERPMVKHKTTQKMKNLNEKKRHEMDESFSNNPNSKINVEKKTFSVKINGVNSKMNKKNEYLFNSKLTSNTKPLIETKNYTESKFSVTEMIPKKLPKIDLPLKSQRISTKLYTLPITSAVTESTVSEQITEGKINGKLNEQRLKQHLKQRTTTELIELTSILLGNKRNLSKNQNSNNIRNSFNNVITPNFNVTQLIPMPSNYSEIYLVNENLKERKVINNIVPKPIQISIKNATIDKFNNMDNSEVKSKEKRQSKVIDMSQHHMGKLSFIPPANKKKNNNENNYGKLGSITIKKKIPITSNENEIEIDNEKDLLDLDDEPDNDFLIFLANMKKSENKKISKNSATTTFFSTTSSWRTTT